MAKSSFSTSDQEWKTLTLNREQTSFDVMPSGDFSYFFRKQNAVHRLCCVLTNTRESVIASRVRVHARLSVCTSWYISSWSVYYCFCPCLKASDWQGGRGTRSSARSRTSSAWERVQARQLAVLAETTETEPHRCRAFNTALPSVSHKHHPHSYQRRMLEKTIKHATFAQSLTISACDDLFSQKIPRAADKN